MIRKPLRYYISVVLLACFMPFATSCIYDYPENEISENGDPIKINFTLSFPGFTGVNESRTGSNNDPGLWDESYDSSEASTWESNFSNFKVLVYKDGNYFGMLTDFVRQSTYGYSAQIKDADGKYVTTENRPDDNLRFHFIVGAASMTEPTNGQSTAQPTEPSTESDLVTNSKIDYYKDNKIAVERMPMWGIKQCKVNTDNDLGTVVLLRSMAKVEIVLSEESKTSGLKLDNAKLLGSLAKEIYTLPTYKYDDNYLAITTEETTSLDRYFSEFEYGKQIKLSDDLKFDANAEGNIVFYVPEQVNTTDSHLSIGLTVSTVDFSECPLEFKNYDSDGNPVGDLYNIIRNHHYRYTVNVIDGTLKIVVEEWEDTFDNEFNFGTSSGSSDGDDNDG